MSSDSHLDDPSPTPPAADSPPTLHYQNPLLPIPEGWTHVGVFRLPRDHSALFWRRMVASLSTLLPLVVVILRDAFFPPHTAHSPLALYHLIPLLVLLGFFAPLAAGSAYQELKNYLVVVGHQGLCYPRTGGTPLIILRDQITNFVEVPHGIHIITPHHPRPVFIYKEVENYAYLRDYLSGIQPVLLSGHPTLFALRLRGLWIAIVIALLLFWVSPSGLIEKLMLIVLAPLLTWSSVRNVFRSRYSREYKVGMVGVHSVLAFAVIMKFFILH